ncbi:sulfotransferase family protein [Psychromonas sp.]|nr:sulfotransferase family protein [Psychromonas sp.]
MGKGNKNLFKGRFLQKLWRVIAPLFIQQYRGKRLRLKKLQENIDTGVVFLHIPKAAGSSIGHLIYGHDRPGHFRLEEYRKLLGDDFQKVLFFTFVREPIDRFKSAFNYLLSNPKNKSDRDFASNVISNYSDINDFIERYLDEKTIYSHIHFYPQVYFIRNEGIVDLDFIGKYENLAEDVSKLCQLLGKKGTLQCHNSRKKNVGVDISIENQEKLMNLYIEDYKELNYGD